MSRYQSMQGRSAKSNRKLGTNEWFTPLEFIERVHGFYPGNFFDAASCDLAQRYIQAFAYATKENSGLNCPWERYTFCNPPYKMPYIAQFAQKAVYEAAIGKEIVFLCNANTETGWFQMLAKACTIRLDFSKRLKFWHPDVKKSQNGQGQCCFYFGERDLTFVEMFGDMGLIYQKPFQLRDGSLIMQQPL